MDILDDMMEQDKLYTYPNKISSLFIDDDNNSVTINNLYLKIPFIDKFKNNEDIKQDINEN